MIRETTGDTVLKAEGLLPSSDTLALPKGTGVALDVICACMCALPHSHKAQSYKMV